MFSPRSVMALLAVLALSAKVVESAIAAPDVCAAADVGKGFCLSCKTKAKCVTANAPAVPKGDCTIAGEACTVLAGVATCKPFANTACTCAKTSQCDAYDPDFALICLSGGVIVSTNCTATGQTCVNGACVPPPPPTPSPTLVCGATTADGFVLTKPMCTSAVYCSGKKPVGAIDCASGSYFDMNDGTCLPLPPVPCAGCGSGACPDKSDCSKWYICDGGVVLDEETCDVAAPVFDINTNECLANGNCTGNANCTYGLTTTAPTTVSTATTVSAVSNSTATTVSNSTATTVSSTTPATSRPALCSATNVGLRYPYYGNCKKYWSCRLVGTNVYAYVESTCLSTLVFNAITTYCDTPANVPGCVPPV